MALTTVQTFLTQDYPWTKTPFISSAPMRLLAGPALAHTVSLAGGVGFIGAGSDVSNLQRLLKEAEALQLAEPVAQCPPDVLPVGVGILNWGADLETVATALEGATKKPVAIWFFAPRTNADLVTWTERVRSVTGGRTKIWIQVGTVRSARELSKSCRPDVFVVQGADAGGHGLAQSSSIISLLPEVCDALDGSARIPLIAAGGIMDGRGVAAAMMLGASGVCMGTRFLVSEEAEIAQGYKDAVITAEDGGVSTVRTKVYDTLRGTTLWPDHYNGRGIINKSYLDWQSGMKDEENKKLYEGAMKLGDEGWSKDEGRMTAYAGTGVGLAKHICPAGDIVTEVIREARALLVPTSKAKEL